MEQPGDSPSSKRREKRAVVIIHGIGDQAPMQTLRSFVDAVWCMDNHLTEHGKRVAWTKPDTMSGNLELRRVTTTEDKLRIRTDFYEFYWAHLMRDTRLSDVVWWIQRLFGRLPSRVPENIAAPWVVGLLAIIIVGCSGLLLVLLSLLVLQASHYSISRATVWASVALAILALLWYLRNRVLIQFVGDAARYLTPAPSNIAARTEIRKAGLALLDELHRNQDYDHIILVCHSLGTVVGYDVLTFLWSEHNQKILHERGEQSEALKKIEEAAARLRAENTVENREYFRNMQRAYSRAISEMTGGRWKITDFVTLGSPLAHAHVLLTDDREILNISDARRVESSWIAGWYKGLTQKTRQVAHVLASRIAERAFPSCPPEPEDGCFSYIRKELNSKPRTPHHAAVFSAVRWTNIYAPRRFILYGDVIGGPVSPLFGPGIKDIALSGPVGRSFIAHVKYWVTDRRYGQEHLTALRAGLNLLDEPERAAWSRYYQTNRGSEEELAKIH